MDKCLRPISRHCFRGPRYIPPISFPIFFYIDFDLRMTRLFDSFLKPCICTTLTSVSTTSSLIGKYLSFSFAVLCITTTPALTMATWWSLIAEVIRIEPIDNSALTNAVCVFPEGDLDSERSELRQVKISFFGDRLICGKSYIMYGGCRLPPNDNFLDQPLVCVQKKLLLLPYFRFDNS
jgi:hypothetical protein